MDNLRRIILVFSISVFLTLAICGIVLSFRNIDKPKETVIDLNPTGKKYNGEADPEDDDDPTEDERKNPSALIIVMGEYNVKNLYFIAKITNETDLSLMFIPADSKISYRTDNNPNYLTITELQNKGKDVLLDALSGKFNLSVENYVITDLSGFGNFVNYFTAGTDGVKFDYPVRHTFYISGTKYDFLSPTSFYDGGEARGIIGFTKTADDTYVSPISHYYDGTDTQRVKMASSFIKEFFAQTLMDKASDNTKTNYHYYLTTFFKKNAETNLTEEQIASIPEIMQKCKSENIKSIVNDLNNNEAYEVSLGEEGYILNKVTEF